jgi:hypothetical protein
LNCSSVSGRVDSLESQHVRGRPLGSTDCSLVDGSFGTTNRPTEYPAPNSAAAAATWGHWNDGTFVEVDALLENNR